MSQSPCLTEEDITRYLKDHPDFFTGKDALLADLTIPHAINGATSLLERQLGVHRERNTELRQKMADLLENARRNDQLFEKTRRLVLALITADDWLAIEAALDDSLRNEFHVDAWALLHFTERQLDEPLRAIQVSAEQRTIHRLFKGHRSICGPHESDTIAKLLGQETTASRSVAATQLRGSCNIGVLTIASNNEATYRAATDTLFLDYISDILALRLAQIPVQAKR